MNMDFFDWTALGSFAGAMLAVSVLTQMTKDLPGIRNMPTQLWSYLLSLGTLVLAMTFNTGFELSQAVLALFNAALISLSANGGYAALERIRQTNNVQQE